ncbi:Homeodomain-like protein [Mycena galericulata]|nr:Homeodomain-like protein [Mycena galericulata]KAJ7482966.1 Homeodomain-like protein [Mycena galericulata]
MTRGKPLSDDLRGVLLNMAMHHDVDTIADLTGVGHRTIERLLSDYRKKGTVVREHMYQELRGRKRCLTGRDTKFLCALVRHSPDIYLAELQEILEDRLGVSVDESTLWRSLKRCGFTMKKVKSHSGKMIQCH